MSKALHFQQSFDAPASAVFHALTDDAALGRWFAEHASVSLDDRRYDFWGRLTPETPDRQCGGHPIQVVTPPRRLRYAWRLRGADTIVDLRLVERDGRCILGLWHHGIPAAPEGQPGCFAMDDVWSLWLEGLRRYLEGKPVARCDFSAVTGGDVAHTVEIAAGAATVWEALADPRQRNRWIASNADALPVIGGVWIDWGPHGVLRVLDMAPPNKLVLAWEAGSGLTTVTARLAPSAGGNTHLTLTHTGFQPTDRTDGHELGWISFLGALQSMVEAGIEWLPPLKEVARDAVLYYAASIWARQEELLGDTDEEWEESHPLPRLH